jgi:hypothetical protein
MSQEPIPVVITPGTRQSKKSSANDFSLVSDFNGYRNKEDITNLPPGYLVRGSQNVLTSTGGDKVTLRQGYTLDGQADTTIAPILSSYDWKTHLGFERNLRVGNGKIQVRYVADAGDKYLTNTFTAGQIFYLEIAVTTSNYVNFADFWDPTNLYSTLLWVNQTTNVTAWTGGIARIASATATTLTKTGTQTWAEAGFANFGTKEILVNGTTYTYTGGEGTTTLTGVSADLSAFVDHLVIQKPVVKANSAITSMPSAFRTDLIAIRKNQVYYGSLIHRSVYISAQNNYTSVAFTSPVRVVGEGGLITLDACPIAFIPQEDAMYISAGQNWMYKTLFQLSSDNSKESLTIEPLKFSELQGAQSQGLVGKVKNDAAFINNEPSMDTIGRVSGVIATPQASNLSDPIKLDFDSYDFTDGHVFYFRYFIFISIPKHGLVRIYNVAKGWWEAPQILPVCRFAIIDGELYGHSYQTPQTFKLFTGYSDQGNPIDARLVMSYQNYGTRSQTKFFNEAYFEGYIRGNTTLTMNIIYDIDGCATDTSYDISGSDSQIVCVSPTDASLGKSDLGKNSLGGSELAVNNLPKMRGIKTFPRKDFYEVQFGFSSYGIDYNWEILAFGPKVEESPYGNNSIKQ